MERIKVLSRIFGYFGSAAVILMLALTVADVLMRFIFDKPIIGAIEVGQILMVMVFLGVPLTTLEESHVSVDLVVNRFPRRVKAAVSAVVLLMTLVICALMAWQAYAASVFSHLTNKTFSLLAVPEYPFYWVMVLCFVAICVVLLGQIIETIREVLKK